MPAKPEDSVEAWHKPACVVYRSVSILPALQMPDLLSLEVRHFDDPHRRLGFDFDPSAVPKDCKSSIQVLCSSAVRSVSKDQLKTLLRSIEALKVIKVKRCSFETTDKLVELATLYHAESLEIIYIDKTQHVHRGNDCRFYYTPCIRHLQNIRDLVVDFHDLYRHSLELREQQPSLENAELLQEALASVLLPSLQRLEVCGMWCNGEPEKAELEDLDIAIAGALGARDVSNLRLLSLSRMQHCSGRSVGGDLYTIPYVRRLSITNLAPYSYGRRCFAPKFFATIEAGHRFGVLVETVYHYKTTCSLFEARPWTEHDMRRFLANGSFQHWERLGRCGFRDCKTCKEGVFY